MEILKILSYIRKIWRLKLETLIWRSVVYLAIWKENILYRTWGVCNCYLQGGPLKYTRVPFARERQVPSHRGRGKPFGKPQANLSKNNPRAAGPSSILGVHDRQAILVIPHVVRKWLADPNSIIVNSCIQFSYTLLRGDADTGEGRPTLRNGTPPHPRCIYMDCLAQAGRSQKKMQENHTNPFFAK